VIDFDDVRRAAARIDGVAHRTPVVRSRTLDERAGGPVALKPEGLQRAGSFKFRGAYNTVASLAPAARGRGVTTASSGNHAQALALAAALHGAPAKILMPEDAPASKAAATAGYGAEIVRFDRYADDREQLLAELAESEGLEIVHPYDDERVMAGQGSAAIELIEDAGELDLLLVPIGGGGLISGCSTAAKTLCGDCEVVGVEPAAGDDTARSLAAGERIRIPVPRTIADGQQLDIPGALTFPVVRERVDRIVTVTDAQIVAAMRFAFERLKLVLEPSGATTLAALLERAVEPDGRRTGVILSGGNIGVDRFRELTTGQRD
jgi:threonine dehydratase